MNTADTIRTIIELLLVVLAIALMIFEPHIAAWEQRAARKALIWALEHIPEFKAWLYPADEDEPVKMPVRVMGDWRNSRLRK